MNICYADVISTKHSNCYPIKDIVLGLRDMSCKESAQFCPRNSDTWAIFKPFSVFTVFLRRGRYS